MNDFDLPTTIAGIIVVQNLAGLEQVLRRVRVASKQELKELIMAANVTTSSPAAGQHAGWRGFAG